MNETKSIFNEQVVSFGASGGRLFCMKYTLGELTHFGQVWSDVNGWLDCLTFTPGELESADAVEKYHSKVALPEMASLFAQIAKI